MISTVILVSNMAMFMMTVVVVAMVVPTLTSTTTRVTAFQFPQWTTQQPPPTPVCTSLPSTAATATTTTMTTTSSRREMIQQTVMTTIAAPLTLSLLMSKPEAANAAVNGLNKVNAKLSTFGLPLITDVPDGFVPLLEIYGKGKNRNPLLVTFSHPLSWIVTLPSNNNMGEDGTIQVGDYGKGDTASLFVDDTISATSQTTGITKSMVEEGLQKCISQRGSNMYQSFKLLKLTDGPGPYLDGQSYQIAEFKYQLITGAGFEVDRKGIASITMSTVAQQQQLEIFWAASIDARYKKTSETLRNIVTSFRCYANGLNFSDEIIA